jgi:ABC-type branched-subunit amino acid transport system ATPase component/branched-subunit amino acid ABC-type transport system permease component
MNDFLPFIVTGIVAGSVYGLTATGLVLTYKTSGIFNFAHGALATTAGYVFYSLHVTHGVPWPVTAAIAVFVLGPILGIVMELIARRLADVRTIYKIVATIGIILIVEGFFTARWGSDSRSFPPYLPTGKAFSISGTNVTWDQVIITLIALAATVALYVFFRFARIGLAMRGVVDNSELLDLAGTNPVQVRRWSWVIGSSFACLAGVLLGPSLSLDALLLTLLVVQAYGAAAVGFFSSLPLTYLGGLLIGVVAGVLTKYGAVTHPNALLTGLPPSVPFLVLFIVLVVTPRRLLVDRRLAARSAVADQWRAPLRVQGAGALILLAGLLIVPYIVSSSKIPIYSDALSKVVLFLSLGLLIRTSGQVSLCHAGFAAIGAASAAHFVTGFHIPWLLAVLLGALVVVPVGAFIAIPAIRLSGVFLALATFGFGIALEQMGYPLRAMFGSSTNGLTLPRPQWGPFTSDRGYYYLLLIFVVLTGLFVAWVHRSRLGRLLRGLGDSPTALSTNGASINTTRVLVFAISAFLAGIYGGLYGGVVTSVSAGSFTSFSSLILVAVLAIALGGDPWYAFFAAAAMTIPAAYISNANVNNWLNVIFGVSAIAVSMTGGPLPVPALRRFVDRLGGRRPIAAQIPPVEPGEELVAPTGAAPDGRSASPVAASSGNFPVEPRAARDGASAADHRSGSGLVVQGLSVQYGGHIVVSDFSLDAPKGRITGLIGPNGAGKTTTFNACCGLARPASGKILLGGKDMSSLSPARRARLGLGRTFQRMELFDSMTVRENVGLGREASMAGSQPWRHLAAGPAAKTAVSEAAEAAIELCGIQALAEMPAGGLSTGQRRLVELARCLAGPFEILLLDEPSSGLNRAETARFGEVLNKVIDERDVGILLIEHDMGLVMDICDYIYVLDFGLKIFEGTPSQVAASDQVKAAYLGSESLSAAAVSEGVGT